jgi:quinol monooxygenase YgiN/catechol 2,3-dioxygenase-like lactoylglutathione lyase family enzyme
MSPVSAQLLLSRNQSATVDFRVFPQGAVMNNQNAVSVVRATRDNGPLGARLRGMQHFGLTVQNMVRAFTFYTEVLGGTEIMRDGDFHGERIHNTLLTDQEIEAHRRQVNPRTIGIPDLKGGSQRLDVRFVQFDNMVLELLQYRDVDQLPGSGASFAEPLDHMSPAFPRMMHLCFYLHDDVDFNKFIADLEAEAARRGMNHVKANRVVTVTSEQDRRATQTDANSNGITEGRSNGWRLIYCKGPEGEQLEFVQALEPVKRFFEDAREARRPDSAIARYDKVLSGAYAVVAEVRAKPGKESELRDATLPLVAQVRDDQHPRNLLYFLHEDCEAPGHFIFYEAFANKADFEAHNATPYVQAWLANVRELADGDVKAVHMEILGN